MDIEESSGSENDDGESPPDLTNCPYKTKKYGRKTKFECDICFHLFNTIAVVNDHKELMHGPNRPLNFRCDVCGLLFRTARWRNMHRRKCAAKIFKCLQCDMRFKKEKTFDNHAIIAHTDQKPFKCDQCKQSFALLGILEGHKRTVHRPLYHQLEIPQSTTDDLTVVLDGQCQINADLSTAVNAATSSTDPSDSLTIDANAASSTPAPSTSEHSFATKMWGSRTKYECDICFHLFNCIEKVLTHKKTHTPDQKPGTPCKYCGMLFYTDMKFNNHIRKCEKRTFACEHCDITFGNPWLLKDHLLFQHSTKKYKCDKCDKLFVLEKHLTEHKKVHHMTLEQMGKKFLEVCAYIKPDDYVVSYK